MESNADQLIAIQAAVFYLSLGNSYDNSMKIFEERCVDEYLREKNALLRATQEEQIRVINDRYNQPELCF